MCLVAEYENNKKIFKIDKSIMLIECKSLALYELLHFLLSPCLLMRFFLHFSFFDLNFLFWKNLSSRFPDISFCRNSYINNESFLFCGLTKTFVPQYYKLLFFSLI
ncbi:hypothetical protein EDEG_00327 [Edhazardia aedis USNM 41457]|uniref:Uncharacterized protein n=1 Tax=Edhazardia aedis (strain USNM 41457) TaxID=1003232 RepID=J9D2B4_EDHAE|nr:hypothetical protein EDEG_00327 [Edhazardia aedis USNM 41457]|eukprot:EJW01981.1 hypothetical protein EDEG_00327 [Edhazardia aedis USNM 41457]